MAGGRTLELLLRHDDIHDVGRTAHFAILPFKGDKLFDHDRRYDGDHDAKGVGKDHLACRHHHIHYPGNVLLPVRQKELPVGDNDRVVERLMPVQAAGLQINNE